MPSFDAHANLANSLVVTAPSPANSGTSLVVSAGQGVLFPAVPFNCIVCPANTLPTKTNAEIIRVTNISTDTFTISRAQEGTTARNIVVGDYIANAITVKSFTDIENLITSGGVTSVAGTANQITLSAATGDVVVSIATGYAGQTSITTLGTVTTGVWNGTAIGDTYISSATTWNAKQSAITFGTGVQSALGVNIGSAGAPILFNGAGGTPSSMVGTNITGTAAGLTAGVASAVAVGGITGLGTGVATALAINVGSAGAFVTFNGAGGTPSSITLTNATGYPTASTSVLGVVKVDGTSITISGGVISAASGSGTVTTVGFTGGLISVANPTTTPALTVAGTSGGIPYFSGASTWASSAALAANALVVGGGAGATPATVATGTGVLTALGVNVGSAGAFVTFNGALGTPSSGTLTNCTFPTLNQNTTGSAASLSISGQTGLLTVTGLASTSRVKIVRDAADTILELGGDYSPTGTWTFTKTGISGNAYPDALSVVNSTAASSGNQQYSSILISGQGWKTASIAASQQVGWRLVAIPIQGTSNPSSQFVFQSQVNGGAFSNRTIISQAGDISSASSTTTGAAGFLNSGGGGYGWSSGSLILAGSDGVIGLFNNAATGFTLLGFGSSSSSSKVALQSSGTTLTVGTADGGTSAGSLAVSGTLAVTGHVTLEGVTSTGATGTGLLVFGTSPTVTLASASTAVTQATTDSSTKIATTAFVSAAVLQSEVTLTDGATITQTLVATQADQNAKVTLGGNRTLAFSGLAAGMRGNIRVIQDGTGSRTLALPANSKVISGGGGAVTLTTTAAAVDILSWYSPDGTLIEWTIGKNYT